MSSNISEDLVSIHDVCSEESYRAQNDVIQYEWRYQDVKESLQTAFKNPPVEGLGTLDRLPTELTAMILANLDLLSYTRFRWVNRYARVLASSPIKYRLVATHGHEGIRCLLRTGLASNFSIDDLHHVLLTPRCASCGEFGGFLFLLTLTRHCLECIATAPELRVATTSAFAKLAHMGLGRLHRLLDVKLQPVSEPGYCVFRRVKPNCLISERQAIATLASQGALHDDMETTLQRRRECIKYRFMATVSFPWYSQSDEGTDYGVECRGCRIRDRRRNKSKYSFRRVYSYDEFSAHFSTCKKSQQLWAKHCRKIARIKKAS